MKEREEGARAVLKAMEETMLIERFAVRDGLATFQLDRHSCDMRVTVNLETGEMTDDLDSDGGRKPGFVGVLD